MRSDSEGVLSYKERLYLTKITEVKKGCRSNLLVAIRSKNGPAFRDLEVAPTGVAMEKS